MSTAFSTSRGPALRTPDERFANLPGYAFTPHFADDLPGFEGLRLHYIDEPARDSTGPTDTFLCLHGQPTWSYLYRKMIPVFAATGARVVAPDLFGFGRSDKPVDEAFYTFTRHREALLAFVRRLDLRDLTLVVQDWGGLLGLTLPPEEPRRFKRLILMNTALATGQGPLGPGFEQWRAFNNAHPDLPIAQLLKDTTLGISDAEAGAYEAPFPDARYKAGVRRFPNLVPDRPDADGAEVSRQAARWWSTQWNGPSFMAVGERDKVITSAAMEMLRKVIRGCPPAMRLADAGHFVQEHGEPVAHAALAAFMSESP